MSSTVDVRDLTVRYGKGATPALDRVSFTVHEGETVAVVGESGSGKSTLIRALLGMLPAGAEVTGRVEVAGRVLGGLSAAELRGLRGPQVGYVAQDPYSSLNPLWNVRHHIAEAWSAHGRRPPADLADRVARLDVRDADRMLRRRPHAWSGGMLQRADLVAATAHEPAILVADEPTSALDAALAGAALESLVGRSRTVLVAAHDLPLVCRFADRILVFHEGAIVEEIAVGRGGIDVLAERAAHPGTRRLVEALPRPRTMRQAGHAPPVARMEAVSLGYTGGEPLLSDVDLTVGAGEIVGLCGRSGSGKTSLLRALSGLLRPLDGSVWLGGVRLWAGRRNSTAPGYVMPIFQNAGGSLDPRWPIWRTVAEPIGAGSPTRLGDLKASAERHLADVGLGDLDSARRPGELSGGQRQRVAIARALAGRPSLIVADEPTAALDPGVAAGIATLLRSVADRGTAMVVASHDEARLASFADRILRVSDRRLAEA